MAIEREQPPETLETNFWDKMPIELLSGGICLFVLYARAVNIFSTHPGHISVAYVQMALLGCLLAMFSLLFLHSSRRRLLCGVCVGANVLALACFL